MLQFGETTSANSGVLVDVGETVDNSKPFPLKPDLKVQVLRVIDALGVAK